MPVVNLDPVELVELAVDHELDALVERRAGHRLAEEATHAREYEIDVVVAGDVGDPLARGLDERRERAQHDRMPVEAGFELSGGDIFRDDVGEPTVVVHLEEVEE